ncbi:formate--tetrahydrofolate ligase [Spiroplasma endosymbiont of Sarcophaga carnaria]|uniref:formate--tetrahydrofolate ligase n=1 Tax=Spiroplasma endosymbiont of Sarcophaga carnaria TaxID=3066303 RepID=UPI0030CE2D12
MEKITTIGTKIGLTTDDLIKYGDYIAKVKAFNFSHLPKKAKFILVTAINPTKAGEGKTTCSIGIADMLNHLGYQTTLALREPSLGPVFGLKGSATGGGECVMQPENEINLHYTGDFHAITTANNMVSAIIDNILYWGNALQIDPAKVVWQRCLDVNDRALRNVKIKINDKIHRNEHFQITAASEIMAILGLSKDFNDLRRRLDQAIVAYNFKNEPVYLQQLQITGSLLALLKDAVLPNLVQTKYGTPLFVHCGPFANISHGANSLIATDLALKLSDYVVIEVGFGSDLGFEKFNDIINLKKEYTLDCTVLVATIRALKLHGGADKTKLATVDLVSLKKGLVHLEHYIKIIQNYRLNFVVCLNQFATDGSEEITLVTNWLTEQKIPFGINNTYHLGIKDNPLLAKTIIEQTTRPQQYQLLFNPGTTSLTDKIKIICEKIYQTTKVTFSAVAQEKIAFYQQDDKYKTWPVCMAKNHQTIFGNKDPNDDHITIRDLKINSGAEYFIAYLADIITMPGLNKKPNALEIEVVNDQIINIK